MAVEVVIRGSNQSGSATSEAARGIREVGEAAGGSEGKLKGFFGLMGGAAAGGALALGGALVGAAGAGLGFNNAMEQARARINAFTKDGAATEQVLAMVADRASKTPFAFEEMATAAASLGPAAKGAGIPLENLIAQAEILAASNPAEGLVGGAFAIKEALSGDFTSAIERFNLSRSYINQLKEEGVPALEILSQAMQQAGYDTDLVSQLANTAQGRWSTFMDTWTMLAGQVTQPIFDAVSQGLGRANEILTELSPQMTAFAQSIADVIAQTLQGQGPIAAFFGQFQPVLEFLQANAIPILGAVAGIIGFGIAGAIASAVVALGGFLIAAAPLIAILAVVGALGALVAANWGPLSAAFQEAGGGIAGAGAALQTLGQIVISWVQSQLPGWIAGLQQMGAAAWQWIVEAIPPAIAQLQAWGGQLLGYLAASAPGWIAQLAAWGAAAWQWIQQAIPPALAQIGAWGGQLLSYLAANLPGWIAQLLQWNTAAWRWLGEAIPPLLAKAGEFIGSLIRWAVGEALPQIVAWGVQAGAAMIAWVATELIPKVGPALADFLGSLVTGLAGVVTGIAQAALSIGQGIIDGIVKGISNGASAIMAAARDAASKALEAAKKLLGISSPSRAFATAVGLPIAQGIAQGISEGTPLVAEASATLARGGLERGRNEINSSRQLTINGGFNVNAAPGQREDQVAGMALAKLKNAMDLKR